MTISNIKKFILLYLSLCIYSVSTICAKLAAQQSIVFRVFVFIGLEIVCLGVYALLWQQVLKCFPLVTAMASKGIVVIFNLIWSILLFKEVISVYNILGAAIIIFGIWMVTSDG